MYRSLRCASLLLAALCLSGPACSVDGPDFSAEHDVLGGAKGDGFLEPKAWTFIHYGAADNNLSSFIRSDVLEMQRVGSSEDVNVVALLDLPEGAQRLFIERDASFELSSPSFSLGAIDSGSPETLRDFLSWAVSEFPAEHYAIAIGGHGGGNPRVIAPDDGTGNAITVPELADALASTAQLTGKRLDLVLADACLMQTVEVGSQMQGIADYLLGSQNTVPGAGLPYDDILRELTASPDMGAQELGRTASEAFARSQPSQADDYVIANVAVDGFGAQVESASYLAKLDVFAEELAAAVRSNPEVAAMVVTAVEQSFRHRGSGLAAGPDDPFADLDRFLFLLENIPDAHLRESAQVLRDHAFLTLDTVFEGRQADALGARGLSAFLPSPRGLTNESIEAYRQSCSFCQASAWTELVRAYSQL